MMKFYRNFIKLSSKFWQFLNAQIAECLVKFKENSWIDFWENFAGILMAKIRHARLVLRTQCSHQTRFLIQQQPLVEQNFSNSLHLGRRESFSLFSSCFQFFERLLILASKKKCSICCKFRNFLKQNPKNSTKHCKITRKSTLQRCDGVTIL